MKLNLLIIIYLFKLDSTGAASFFSYSPYNERSSEMEAGSTVSAVRSSKVLIGDEVRPALITIKYGKIHNILPDPGASAHEGGEVSWEFVWEKTHATTDLSWQTVQYMYEFIYYYSYSFGT